MTGRPGVQDQAFQKQNSERAEVRGSAVLPNASVADRYARLDLPEATVSALSAYTPGLPRSACLIMVPVAAAAIP